MIYSRFSEYDLTPLFVPKGGTEGTEAKAKHSLAYIQLEKQNERLKEALFRQGLLLAILFYFSNRFSGCVI